jgi:hypothetical protein
MKLRVLVVGIVVVLTMLACQPQFLSKLEPEETGSVGTIQMKIPEISYPLAKALGVVPQKTGSASKAFLIITKVDLHLLLGSEVFLEKTVSVSYYPGWGGEPIEWPLVPAADGYSVEAWIYNENVDSEEPLLHGVSDTFSVVSGADTEVTIRPTPISPIGVPLAPSSVHASLYSCWDTGEVEDEGFAIDPGPDEIWDTPDDIIYYPPIYGWAEERWFEIDASGYDAIRVNADVSANSGVFFLVADALGRSRAQALSGAMGNGGPAYWNYGGIASAGVLTPDSTCYVGLVTVSSTIGSSVLSSVDVSFAPFSDDPYEENDSIGAAYLVNKTEVYNGIDLDPVNWSGYPATGGDWYKFVLTTLDDPNVAVAIAFDHDESDLVLELYEWVGPNPNMIEESDESEVSGPGEPVLEMELIEATLVPGIYYIWVHGNNTVGSDYQLQWVAGTGTIIIGIE